MTEIQKYINFIQYNVPGLKTGRYKLNIQQNVTAPETQTFQRSYTFDVPGDRFSLDQKDVHGVFPPGGSRGEFDNALPHITLNRVRFPWLAGFDPGNEDVPWITLLMFDDQQNPESTRGKVSDLVESSKKVRGFEKNGELSTPVSGSLPEYYYSHFTALAADPIGLNYGESDSEVCNYIDIPAGTFNEIAPSAADVAYLAHVRHVDTVNKSAKHQATEYATVVGNRVPQLGRRTYVHLVSLNGLDTVMPNDSDYTPQLANDYTHVRLVSLFSWSFDAVEVHREFFDTVASLNLGTAEYAPGTLTYPLNAPPPTTAKFQEALTRQENGSLQAEDAEILVAYAIAMGYIAVPHQTRQGGQTVSWYRGPFTPYDIKERILTNLPVNGSDALTGYNSATGIFDVSYASAWQIGQLLALQDKTVARALHQWKRKIREKAIISSEGKEIDKNYLSGSRLDRAISYLKQFEPKEQTNDNAGRTSTPTNVNGDV